MDSCTCADVSVGRRPVSRRVTSTERARGRRFASPRHVARQRRRPRAHDARRRPRRPCMVVRGGDPCRQERAARRNAERRRACDERASTRSDCDESLARSASTRRISVIAPLRSARCSLDGNARTEESTVIFTRSWRIGTTGDSSLSAGATGSVLRGTCTSIVQSITATRRRPIGDRDGPSTPFARQTLRAPSVVRSPRLPVLRYGTRKIARLNEQDTQLCVSVVDADHNATEPVITPFLVLSNGPG